MHLLETPSLNCTASSSEKIWTCSTILLQALWIWSSSKALQPTDHQRFIWTRCATTDCDHSILENVVNLYWISVTVPYSASQEQRNTVNLFEMQINSHCHSLLNVYDSDFHKQHSFTESLLQTMVVKRHTWLCFTVVTMTYKYTTPQRTGRPASLLSCWCGDPYSDSSLITARCLNCPKPHNAVFFFFPQKKDYIFWR